MKVSKNALKVKAKNNTTVTSKSSGDTHVLKEGIPLTKTSAHITPTLPVVGMSKGVTKNMGDYESLRVDVWLSIPCDVSEIEETYRLVENTIDEVLEESLEQYM